MSHFSILICCKTYKKIRNIEQVGEQLLSCYHASRLYFYCSLNQLLSQKWSKQLYFRFTAKLIMSSLVFFLLPFIVKLIETCYSSCGWEEQHKFLMTLFYALQAIVLSFAFFLHPNVRKIFKNFNVSRFFSKKISSQESALSLAASGPSVHSIDYNEPVKSWNDFVIRAQSSICDGNLYSVEPRSAICTSPDPLTSKSRISLISHPLITQQIKPNTTRRHTVRDIMMNAKNNLPKNRRAMSTTLSITKCATPPLPKNIPNQILDDVQLFEFYYKNLNSVFINDSTENSNHGCLDAVDKRSSIEDRMTSFGRGYRDW